MKLGVRRPTVIKHTPDFFIFSSWKFQIYFICKIVEDGQSTAGVTTDGHLKMASARTFHRK
jgi:hypothetical protein